MGNVVAFDNKFYIYRRMRVTDKYREAPDFTFTDADGFPYAVARFKHEVYRLGIGHWESFKDTKCIYLYHGRRRVARCEGILDENGVVVSIVLNLNAYTADEWYTVSERAREGGTSTLRHTFDEMFTRGVEDKDGKTVFTRSA